MPKGSLNKGHTSLPVSGQPSTLSQQEYDNSSGERIINVNTSPSSSSKPPKVRRAYSAEQKATRRSPSPSSSSIHEERSSLSNSPASKKAKVAWDSTDQDKSKEQYREESTSVDPEVISNGHTDSHIHELTESNTQSNSPQNISSMSSFREYDEETLSVLNISFPPSTTPTLGLSRAVSPPETQWERYSSLVENAILTSMVAPLSKEWKKKTHEFLPKTLRCDFKETLDELDKVCYSVTVSSIFT